MLEPANNIVKFSRKNKKGKVELTVPPEHKVDLLEHVMLFQMDGPDEFWACYEAVIERFKEVDCWVTYSSLSLVR